MLFCQALQGNAGELFGRLAFHIAEGDRWAERSMRRPIRGVRVNDARSTVSTRHVCAASKSDRPGSREPGRSGNDRSKSAQVPLVSLNGR
jgi:hypothetical protein